MDAANKKQQSKKSRRRTAPTSNAARIEKIKKLFEEWLQDSSGYDEETWPQLKQTLNENHSMSHNLLLE